MADDYSLWKNGSQFANFKNFICLYKFNKIKRKKILKISIGYSSMRNFVDAIVL